MLIGISVNQVPDRLQNNTGLVKKSAGQTCNSYNFVMKTRCVNRQALSAPILTGPVSEGKRKQKFVMMSLSFD